jgi:hypothetical protein
MPGNSIEEKYYEERFKSLEIRINASHELLDEKLTLILQQTTKTNGSVIRLRDDVDKIKDERRSCPINEVKTAVDAISEDFNRVKRDIDTWRFAHRNPVVALLAVGGGVVVVAWEILKTFVK